MVKNLPAMQETQVHSLGWEDPLEKGILPTPVFLSWKSHGQRSQVGSCPWGTKKVGHNLATKQQQQNKEDLISSVKSKTASLGFFCKKRVTC